MGSVALEGFGGGGGTDSALRVVGGTTRPQKPTPNMIWANTPNDITGYVFYAAEPSNSAEGMLWIILADSSRIKIASPVGDDWITVYPLKAKQFISGAWVDVEAMSYQEGEWVDWVKYLFKSGKGARVPLSIYHQSNATIVMNTNSITTSVLDWTQGYTTTSVISNDKIDLSKYSKLYITVTVDKTAGESDQRSFGLLSTNPQSAVAYSSFIAVKKADDIRSEQTVYLDISGFNDSYYVATRFSGTVTIKDFWLE